MPSFLNISDHKDMIMTDGLIAAGYEPIGGNAPTRGDVVIAWNRKSRNEDQIKQFEDRGGAAIIAENGYAGHDERGHRLIALAFHGHLGRGSWPVGHRARWRDHGIELKPWRNKPGGEIVILAQRGIGFTSVDEGWALNMQAEIRKRTPRKVRIRWHPGKEEPVKLEDDIADAHSVVTYSSAAAIKAIISGIPCFYMMHGWIGAGAAVHGIDNIEQPYLGDRMSMLHSLSWAQWTQDEVATGLAFKMLREFYENSPLFLPRAK